MIAMTEKNCKLALLRGLGKLGVLPVAVDLGPGVDLAGYNLTGVFKAAGRDGHGMTSCALYVGLKNEK